MKENSRSLSRSSLLCIIIQNQAVPILRHHPNQMLRRVPVFFHLADIYHLIIVSAVSIIYPVIPLIQLLIGKTASWIFQTAEGLSKGIGSQRCPPISLPFFPGHSVMTAVALCAKFLLPEAFCQSCLRSFCILLPHIVADLHTGTVHSGSCDNYKLIHHRIVCCIQLLQHNAQPIFRHLRFLLLHLSGT